MEYFLGKTEIDKIKESSFNKINCVAQYDIQENDFGILRQSSESEITIGDRVISCRIKESVIEENVTTKIFHSGNLSQLLSEFAENEILQSSIEKWSDFSWRERINIEIVSNHCTLLSFCHKRDKSEYLRFDSGKEFIKLDHNINLLQVLNFENKYLALITYYNIDGNMIKTKVVQNVLFLLKSLRILISQKD